MGELPRSRRARLPFLRMLLMAGTLTLSAQPVWPAAFDVKDDRLFGKAEAVVSAYARARHAKGINNFCVLGQLAEDQEKSAWIIWRQKHEIILWEGQDLVSTRPRRVIDLKKDVVRSESELHGSTYRVTRRWATDLISECEKAGWQITVTNNKF